MVDSLIYNKEKEMAKKLQKELDAFKPDVSVTKWVDYSSKYGIAYNLSNQTMGINFNDSTIIVLDKDYHHIDYLVKDADD